MGDSSMGPPQRAQKAKTSKREQTVAKTTAKNTSRSPVSKFKQSSATRKGLKAGKTSYSGFKTRKNQSFVKSVKTQKLVHEYTEIGLQDFAILLFGEDAVSEVKKKMDVREIWNISTNTTQCNNVIGSFVNRDTDCWICGLKIDKDQPGMEPECEHVLPVAQAVIYLSLYSSKKPPKTDAERKLLEMEYGWAHNICNQDKSDICCIINSGQSAIVSDHNIRYILNKIYNSNRAASGPLKKQLKKLYPTLTDFVRGRLGAVKTRYEHIVNFLNPTHGENRFKLTILAGLVTAMDYTNIHDKAQSLLSDEFIAERESQKNTLKDLLTDTVKEDIFKNFAYGGLDTLGQIVEIIRKVNTYFETQKNHYLETLSKESKRLYSKIPEYEKKIGDFDTEFTNMLTNDPVVERVVKSYPQLYVKLALIFINPVTKTYSKAKIESDCIQCFGIYLLLFYFDLLNISMSEEKNWSEFKTEHVDKIIKDNREIIDTKYAGAYDLIDENYKTKNSNDSMA